MEGYYNQMEGFFDQHIPAIDRVGGSASGDPHFIGFNNQNFDRQPRTDAIYFKNSAAEFEIHARHKLTNSTHDSPTWISAIAIKIKTQTIEYRMIGTNFLDAKTNGFLIDGKPCQLNEKGLLLRESKSCIVLQNAYTFHVYTDFGVKLTVYNCGGYNLNITLIVPRSLAQSAEPSLFGNVTGGYGEVIEATGLFSVSQASANESASSGLSPQGAGNLMNDANSKQYIEELLRKQGISHQPTINNLVFDYLNTPNDLRNKIIEHNIDSVKDQIAVRERLIQAQKQAGHDVGSFDIVESATRDEQNKTLLMTDFKCDGCSGRPCEKCRKCRDWYFTCDDETWNWVCNYKNWKNKDITLWCNRNTPNEHKDMQLREGAKCYSCHPTNYEQVSGVSPDDVPNGMFVKTHGFGDAPFDGHNGPLCLCSNNRKA